MTAPVREFAAGQAMFTRHDAHTRHQLDDYRKRLNKATNRKLLAEAYYAERLRHPLAGEVRRIVEREVEWRLVTKDGFADWWTATIAGGAR